jgi:hypothetical protein
VHRAGIAHALEPPLCWHPGLAAGAGTFVDGSAIRHEAWGGILMALPQGISIPDMSVIHPLSMSTFSQAATTAGAAASHQDQQKRTGYAGVEPHGYSFVPFSVDIRSPRPAGDEAPAFAWRRCCRPWQCHVHASLICKWCSERAERGSVLVQFLVLSSTCWHAGKAKWCQLPGWPECAYGLMRGVVLCACLYLSCPCGLFECCCECTCWVLLNE